MTDTKPIKTTIEKIIDRLGQISLAKVAPEAARKELETAVIGHKAWDGFGLREINNKDGLHRRAVDAVSAYLVADLKERKRAEIRALADEIDELRAQLVIEAEALRFALVDDVRESREWGAA